MATPRLTFLYPPFFRSISRRPEGAWQQTCLSVQLLSDRIAQKPKRRILHTSSGHRQAHVERHGKAVEGFPVAGIAKPAGQATSGAPANEKDSLQGVDADAVKAVSGAMTQPVVERAQTGQDTGARRVEKQPGKSASARGRSGTQSSKGKQASEGSGRAEELVEGELPAANTVAEPPSSGPLAAILHMPAPPSPAPPTSSTSHFLDVDHASDVAKPPLQTPPYVHHFDTYTLVQRVELGGFTTKQSITFMKAVRGLLARNLDVAREGLVSKSDVENVGRRDTRYWMDD